MYRYGEGEGVMTSNQGFVRRKPSTVRSDATVRNHVQGRFTARTASSLTSILQRYTTHTLFIDPTAL